MGEVSLHSQCAILGELLLGTLDRIRDELTIDGFLGPYVGASLDTGRRQVVEYLITMYYKQKLSGVLMVKEELVEEETTSPSESRQAEKRHRVSSSSSLSRTTYKNGETVNKKQKLKVQVDNCGDNAEEFNDDEIDDMSLNVRSDLDNISLGTHDDTDNVPDIARSTTTPAKNTNETTNITTVSKSNVKTEDPQKTTPVVVVKDIFDQNTIWVDPSSLTTDKPVDFGAREDETKPLEHFQPFYTIEAHNIDDNHSGHNLRVKFKKENTTKSTTSKRKKAYYQRAREKLKNDPVAYEEFKRKDAKRVREYRRTIPPDNISREKSRLRMKKYRERKKAQKLYDEKMGKKAPETLKQKQLRVEERNKRREQWRAAKRKKFQSMDEEEKAAFKAKRRKYYHEKLSKSAIKLRVPKVEII